MIKVLQRWTPGKNGLIINTTSASDDKWSRGLSPFYLGPCDLYGGYVAKRMENGWQYSKVYPEFIGKEGNILPTYSTWAIAGWNSERAERYPMGKGAKPLFSIWMGKKYNYIQARRHIYIPLYAKAVVKTEAFATLKHKYEECLNSGIDLILTDFDAYDHNAIGLSYEEVINNPKKKMGHAFVLAMLLENQLDLTFS